MLHSTPRHRLNLNNFLFFGERLLDDRLLPAHHQLALTVILEHLEAHAAKLYPPDTEAAA